MSWVRVHGKLNCEKRGRFAWAAQFGEVEWGLYEQDGAWCKKHTPKHIAKFLEQEDRPTTPEEAP